MLIRIRYSDESAGLVDESILDRLIDEKEIKAFLRSTGWVQIGVDPVRRRFADRRRQGHIINTYV